MMLLSEVVVEQTRVAHVGEVGVLALLLNVDGVGILTWLFYVGDGGLLARVLHADDVGVLVRILNAGGVGAAVVGLLLLHVALGVAASHGLYLWREHHLVPPLLPLPCPFFADCLLLFFL